MGNLIFFVTYKFINSVLTCVKIKIKRISIRFNLIFYRMKKIKTFLKIKLLDKEVKQTLLLIKAQNKNALKN